jgi:hypothetical protein
VPKDWQAIAEGLQKEVNRLRKQNRDLKQQLRSQAMFTKSIPAIYSEVINNYSGGAFDRLSPSGKFLTATSWGLYPGESFDNLVEELRLIDEDLAEAVASKGISYEILGEGDSCKASGFAGGYFAVDTEEWYTDIPRRFRSVIDSDEHGDAIRDAIANFEVAVIQELREHLKSRGISDTQIKEFNQLVAE